MFRLIKNALWVWVLFQAVAVMLGVVREVVLAGTLPPLGSGLLTTQTEIVLVLFFTWLALKGQQKSLTRFRLGGLGLFWLAMSGLMEVVFPRYVLGRPWGLLTEPYGTLQGRLHGVVLLLMLLAPLITGWRATRAAPKESEAAKEDAPPPFPSDGPASDKA